MDAVPYYPLDHGIICKIPNLPYFENSDFHCGRCAPRQERASMEFPGVGIPPSRDALGVVLGSCADAGLLRCSGLQPFPHCR